MAFIGGISAGRCSLLVAKENQKGRRCPQGMKAPAGLLSRRPVCEANAACSAQQGHGDFDALDPTGCGPCVCFVPWAALASCRPLPQQLLPVSATGGGRRRCKQGAARPFQPQRRSRSGKMLAASLNAFFSLLRFGVAARRTVRSSTFFICCATAAG